MDQRDQRHYRQIREHAQRAEVMATLGHAAAWGGDEFNGNAEVRATRYGLFQTYRCEVCGRDGGH